MAINPVKKILYDDTKTHVFVGMVINPVYIESYMMTLMYKFPKKPKFENITFFCENNEISKKNLNLQKMANI